MGWGVPAAHWIRAAGRLVRRITFVAGAIALLGACDHSDSDARGAVPERTDTARVAVAESVTTNTGPVDSALTSDELLRRFREGLDSATSLSGGAPSKEELAMRFVRALTRQDTAAFRALLLDRSEFAYLFFPSNKLATAPYAIDPALLWFQLRAGSENGLTRLFERYGRKPVRMVALSCSSPPEREGENTLWPNCVLALVHAADTTRLQAFGSILERGGRYKFVSYSNDL